MHISRLLIVASLFVTIVLVNCSPKNQDADIKKNIEAKLKAVPGMDSVVVDVMNGIVNITGECKDSGCNVECEKIAQDIKGVKTVINNLAVTSQPAVPVTVPATPLAVAPELTEPVDPLTKSVEKVVKKYPTVRAEVNDGIVTLTGEIRKSELPKLMKAISSLKPIKIDQKLKIVNNTKKKTQKQKHKKKSRRR